jgi:hypothetical protein
MSICPNCQAAFDPALPACPSCAGRAGGASHAGPFRSILFLRDEQAPARQAEPPACVRDLNLDQVVAAIAAEGADDGLQPFFYAPPGDEETVEYRQAVMRDLDRPRPMQEVEAFSQAMRTMRAYRARAAKSTYEHEKTRWFLNAVEVYCGAVDRLRLALEGPEVQSEGLTRFCGYLGEYTASAAFCRLREETRDLVARLSSIRYTVFIRGGTVTVGRDEGEADYTAEIERTFLKFRSDAPGNYLVRFPEGLELNHVEASILDGVARLHPDQFRALGEYSVRHAGYEDGTIARFDREVQFYVACWKYLARFRRAGLGVCLPRVSRTRKRVAVRAAFDLALADQLLRDGAPVVCNDISLQGVERILVVSGPNQGGKTTFARMFGQVHYLASLGCPVPAAEAELFLPDRIFTHFEREEDIETLRGKLKDELVRLRRTLDAATPASIVIMNELFSSTTLHDAVALGRETLQRVSRLDALAVCVTFLTELAAFDEKTVSLVALIDPSDPARRTFKVARMPADGLAYALAIAEKHRVTYRWLEERIRS